MKLIVQIPCLNEEETLPQTVRDIPREIPGVDRVEILVIDDCSTDRTVEVARELGVDHLVLNKTHMGLAQSFRRGLDAALRAGADIVVNTDGDNQYAGADIPKLIQPILAGESDIVIGDRRTNEIEHFSGTKKLLQRVGSATVRKLANATIPDAVCGFRAISREAAIQLNIVSNFSYTTEMLIQAGRRRLAMTSVPIRTNPQTRPSRLFKSSLDFILKSLITMIRTYAMYQPLRMFFYVGTTLFVVGAAPMVRFLYHYTSGDGDGHIQSLIIGGSFLIMGFITYMVALVADLISVNRRLLESTLERVNRNIAKPQ
jgi:glycosyltransferase involved in cell wall biosynthesis